MKGRILYIFLVAGVLALLAASFHLTRRLISLKVAEPKPMERIRPPKESPPPPPPVVDETVVKAEAAKPKTPRREPPKPAVSVKKEIAPSELLVQKEGAGEEETKDKEKEEKEEEEEQTLPSDYVPATYDLVQQKDRALFILRPTEVAPPAPEPSKTPPEPAVEPSESSTEPPENEQNNEQE